MIQSVDSTTSARALLAVTKHPANSLLDATYSSRYFETGTGGHIQEQPIKEVAHDKSQIGAQLLAEVRCLVQNTSSSCVRTRTYLTVLFLSEKIGDNCDGDILY